MNDHEIFGENNGKFGWIRPMFAWYSEHESSIVDSDTR